MTKLMALGVLAGGSVVGGAAAIPVYQVVRSAHPKSQTWDMKMVSAGDYMYSGDKVRHSPHEELSMLRETIRHLEADLRDNQRELNVQSKNFSLMSKNKMMMLDKIDHLEKEIARLTAEKDALDRRIADLQKKSDDLEKELMKWQQKLSAQRSLLAGTKDGNATLEQRLKSAVKQEGELRKENSELEDKVSELRTKLDETRRLLKVEKKTQKTYYKGVMHLADAVTRLRKVV